MRIAPQIILQAAALLATALTVFAYPDLTTAKPSPEPALPAGFDSYSPPVTAANPPAAAPVFAEWTRTGGPTETVVMTGQRFSTFTGPEQGKDTSFLVFGQTTAANQKLAPGIIRRLDGAKVAMGLDPGLPPDSMYLIWAGNQNGYSTPIPVNKTDAWWIGPERATRGNTVSVYGRSLSRGASSNLSSVYVKRPGNFNGVWATVTAANPYKVDFVVPSTLGNGSYEVWVHNGRGGHYGWSSPLTLTVDNGPGWTGQEFNVKGFGATGNGSTDDGDAIAEALDNLAALPGSTLYFPAGVYQITDLLEIPSNVRLRGEGRNTTSIRLKVTDPANPPLAAIYAAGDNIEIRDLTLTAAGTLPTDFNKFVYILASATGVEDLRFTNVRISGAGSNTFNLDGPRRLFFKDCEVIGRNGFLLEATQVFFAGCSFYQTNDAQVPVWAYSGKDISMTGCNTRDLDNSNPAKGDGWGLGRWFVGTGFYGTQRHVYLGDNTSTDLGVRPEPAPDSGPNQNSGEQFLWELNNFYFSGAVTTATATGATLSGYTGNIDNFVPNQNDNDYDTEVIVVDGTGLGQHRAISAVDFATGRITITEPWNVIPDSSSKVVVMTASEKVAVYRNYLDGKPYVYQQEAHIASAGVQPYEGALDFVVDGNTFHEIRYALSLWSYSGARNKPSYFGSYINNLIENNRWGVTWITQAPGTGVSFLGNVFRGNTIRGVLLDGFAITDYGGTNPKPWVDMNVIERTSATNLPSGISRSGPPGAMLNTIILRNSFSRGLATLTGSKGVTFLGNESPSLRENTWTGFENTYAGTLPGPILESPYRVISVDGFVNGAARAASLEIWDAGTAPLTWAASSNAPWLKLLNNSGTVAGENVANTLSFTCDPQGLAIGSYTGYITITASSQTKIVKVLFGVGTAPNTTPTISDIANQTINEDAVGGTGAISFIIGDAETAAGSLAVAGNSSNTALVPKANIVFGGSGASRTVTVTSAANQSGTATITVTVNDGTLSKSDTFLLTVNAVNDRPTISDLANRAVNEDTGTGALPFTVGDVETAAASLTLTRGSSNQALVPDANIVLGGSGASRTVTVTPAANQSGTATITVTVNDGQLSTSDTFLLTVNAVNDPPTISNIADRTVPPNTGTGAIPFTVGDVETPAASLTVTRASSNQALVPDASIVLGGSGASRNVTATPAANQSGTATITVTVSDGTASASDTFLLTVTSNTAPTISDIANKTINEDGTTGAISFTIGDAETAAGSLTVTRGSSNTTLVPTANIVLGGSGASRSVTVKPAANQSGTATLTVTVSDGSLSKSDAFVLAVNAVNDAPSFTKGPDQKVGRTAGVQTISAWATNLKPGPPEESGQVVNFLVENDNAAIFATPPAIAADGMLTFTPATKGSGKAIVTVRLHDNGGTANGGVDTSAPQAFTITVTSIAGEAGQYNGLVQAPGGQAPENDRAGRIRVSLLATGAFTGQLIVGGKVFVLAGACDQTGIAHFGLAGVKGAATLALHRVEQPDLLLSFKVDVTDGTDKLTGKLTENGTDFATLEADRDIYTTKLDPTPPFKRVPSSLLGRYTVVFSAKAPAGAGAFPRGYGYGTVVLAPSGIATLAGMLPDGRAVTYANAISKNNVWPFYVALYTAMGSVSGPLTFRDAAALNAVDGPNLNWFKPVTTGWYPAAFSGQVTVLGSHYVAPPVRPQILDVPDGLATFTVAGGNVTTEPPIKHLSIDSRNRVRILGTERFMMTLLPAPVPPMDPPPPPTGLFSGTFYDIEKKARPFKGVVLQKQNVGFGLFKGSGATGSVELEPIAGP